MDDDSPDDVAHRMFAAQLFADHPLGRETAGESRHVQAINADDVRGSSNRTTTPASMVVASPAPIDARRGVEARSRRRSPTCDRPARSARAHAPGAIGA